MSKPVNPREKYYPEPFIPTPRVKKSEDAEPKVFAISERIQKLAVPRNPRRKGGVSSETDVKITKKMKLNPKSIQ